MCAECRAHKRVKQVPDQRHNLPFLISMLAACYDPASCCSATGRSLHSLRKIGERLSLDRINPRRGYVPGNVQLLVMSLNEEKKVNRRVPQSSVNALLKRLESVSHDNLTPSSAAAQTT